MIDGQHGSTPKGLWLRWLSWSFLSVVLPGAITTGLVLTVLFRMPLNEIANQVPAYRNGVIKDGELWFPVVQTPRPGAPGGAGRASIFIRRLNLATGVVSDTTFEIPRAVAKLTLVDGDIYICSGDVIYRIEESSIRELPRLPPDETVLQALPFLYERQLTALVPVIELDAEFPQLSVFRLVHLVGNAWISGPKIVLPEYARVWVDDPQQGQPRLFPRTAGGEGMIGNPLTLTTLEDQDSIHLIVSDGRGFTAYRHGFQTVGDPTDVASARIPANAPPEVSGWERPISKPHTTDYWYAMRVNDRGVVFRGLSVLPDGTRLSRQIQRSNDGRWMELHDDVLTSYEGVPVIIPSDSDRETYFLRELKWQAADIILLSDNDPTPTRIHLKGCEGTYLVRWGYILVSVAIGWLLHLVMISVGTKILPRGDQEMIDEFRDRQIILASLAQRGLAFAIDVSLSMLVVLGCCWIASWLLQRGWTGVTAQQMADALQQLAVEASHSGWWEQKHIVARAGSCLSLALLGHIDNDSELPVRSLVYGTAIDAAIVLFLLRVYFEGRTGLTPGKWLLGIRAVQMTHRPCGFSKAFARNLLFWFDIPLLLTPWPAITSTVVSPTRQRLGDRVADTIVIRADRPQRNGSRPVVPIPASSQG